MKKFIFSFALLIMAQASAQSFKWGVFGYFDKSSIVGIHDLSRGKYGGGIGAFADFSLIANDVYDSSFLYFSPEIEYNLRGEFADAEPTLGKQKYNTQYIATNLSVKYYFHEGNYKRNIYLFLGPKFEYLTSYKKSGPPIYQIFAGQDEKMNNFGIGITGGIGVHVSHCARTEVERYGRVHAVAKVVLQSGVTFAECLHIFGIFPK